MAVDYEALAKQFGGTTAPAVDYDKLASQYGGVDQKRQNLMPERAPAWAKDSPQLYQAAVKARQVLGPTVEAGGAIIGGGLGATAGTFGAGPVGTATGGVAGAGLGYGLAKELLEQADVALGLKAPRQGTAIATEPVRNVLEGATYEAGGRVAAPIVAKGVGKVAESASNLLGRVADLRQMPVQKAGEIARASVKGSMDDVITALRNAKPGQTPAQALAEAGLNEPVAQALLKDRLARDSKFLTDLAKAEDFKTTNALVKLAGGESATTARASREVAKEELNKLLVPRLETEIEAANIAGKLKPKLERDAQRLAQAAASKVEDVRRFEAAADRASKAATQQVVEKGLPTGAARYTYTGELAEKAKDVATKAAEASLPFGEAAAFKQAAADSLAAYKLTPLTSESIVNAISKKLTDPKIAPNKDVARALAMTADDMVKWTNADGIIDGWALENIRKNVGANIQSLMPTVDVASQKRLAAKVMAEVKPLIVDAIEAAGGTGYRQYLADYSKGMQNIGQSKLGAEALKLYKQSPEQFVRLVEGNSPEIVEKIFGPGSYNIAVEMSDDAYKTLKSTAKQVSLRSEIESQATAGGKEFVDLLKEHSINVKLPNWFSIIATTINKALDIVGKRISDKSFKILTESAKDAKSFEELLKKLPTSDQNAILKTLKDPQVWSEMSKKYTGAGALGVNALAPKDQQNENALAK